MLRVECEQCKAPYQVDERRIPPNGLKMRCPKCGNTFVVKASSGTPVVAPAAAPVPVPLPSASPAKPTAAPPARSAEATRAMRQTMIGVAPGSPGANAPPVAKPAAAPPAAAPPTGQARAAGDDDLPARAAPNDLPARAAPHASAARAPNAPPPRAPLNVPPARVAANVPAARVPPGPAPTGPAPDDLPVRAPATDLPARAVPRKLGAPVLTKLPVPGAPNALPARAASAKDPSPRAGSDHDLAARPSENDLPARASENNLPARPAGADLPARAKPIVPSAGRPLAPPAKAPLAVPSAAKPHAAAPAPAPAQRKPTPSFADDDPFAGLPSAAVPKPLPGAAKKLPPSASMKTVPEIPAAKLDSGSDIPAALGSLDDLDLPITSGRSSPRAPADTKPRAPEPMLANQSHEVDLPTAVPSLPSTQRFAPAAARPLSEAPPAPAPFAAPPKRGVTEPFDFEIDLPSTPNDLPTARTKGHASPPAAVTHGELDLGSGDDELSLGIGLDLPPPAKPAPTANAPVKSGFAFGDGGDFGEIDLPSINGELPMVASSLPSTYNALPALSNALPTVANALPSPTDARRHLPSLKDDSLGLDSLADGLGDFGELDLPPAQGAGVSPSLPPLQSVGPGPRPASLRPPSDLPPMGDLDLPPPAAAPPRTFGSPSFESSRPPASGNAPNSLPEPQKAESRATGGMGFGEVDLGGGDSDSGEASFASEDIPQRAVSTRPGDGGAASIPVPAGAPGEAAIPQGEARQRERGPARKKARGPRIALAGLVLVILGGGALELTPYGAFGRNAVSDLMHAGDYQRATNEAAAGARKQMATDVYPNARAAVDAVAHAHADSPRARSLGAYAALAEFEAQLRFGSDSDRAARARQWLTELPKDTEVRYAPAAQAALDALLGDLPKARKGLEAASQRDAGDPIQEDIAFTRGELELRAKDPVAALAAFNRALTLRPGARAHFGLARAHVVAGDFPSAKKAVEAALVASPNDAGAHVLRAQLAWDVDKAETPALTDLAAVLEGDLKAVASPSDQAAAHAQRGWIHAVRGRSAEARAAFESSLKLEPRNVKALLGQGEVLFTEGRYTEAMTRFDTAVQADPTSIDAIVADAKAKLALERLGDAKKQLTVAREATPKNGRLAYWLGKVEEALGNKKEAEKQYGVAIDLADPTQPDAIQPYVALAGLLAGSGRTKEAQGKLEEAHGKLPDSAAMQRALGEIAATQGAFDEAVQHYQHAIEKDPQDVSTRFRLGVTLRRMRKMDLATAEFDKVLATDKDYPGLAVERGLLYEESGDVDRALEQFQSALAKAPDDPDLQLRVGAAYAAIGRPNDAIVILKKVLEKRSNSAEANHYLGRAYFLQGGSKEVDAMRFLKRAVELDPNRAEYHLYVAWAANNAVPAQLGLAKDEIEKALTIDKLLADGYWQRGVLERKEGAVEDAIRDLKHALELRPTRSEAHAALGECYEDKNEGGTALAEWAKAVAGDERQAFWRYRYGRLLLERGSAGEAVKHLAFAVTEAEKMEQHPAWLASGEFGAAEALRRTGKKADAIEKYRRFLELAPTNSPDRRDAINALNELGAPWNPNAPR